MLFCGFSGHTEGGLAFESLPCKNDSSHFWLVSGPSNFWDAGQCWRGEYLWPSPGMTLWVPSDSESGTRMRTGNSLRQFTLKRCFLPASRCQAYASCLSLHKGNLYWEFSQTPTRPANMVPQSRLQRIILTHFHSSFSPQLWSCPTHCLSRWHSVSV